MNEHPAMDNDTPSARRAGDCRNTRLNREVAPAGGRTVNVIERGYSNNKDAVRKRLRRIESQVRGLQRTVDEDAYCVDVLPQISATTVGLQAVALELLETTSATASRTPSKWAVPTPPRRCARPRPRSNGW
jgi:DNA-binding FrmR family transcriptional regulator